MLVDAGQVADTLRLLVPGFVLAKTFYLFGLRTKRSDAQWVIWSILAAVPVNALANWLVDIAGSWLHRGKDANLVLALALVLAVAGGWLLAKFWHWLVAMRPEWGADAAIRAWDNVFGRNSPEWIQVMLTDRATVYSGKPLYAARSVQTDDLDLYLLEPALLVDGRPVELAGVEGILLPRSQISVVAVFQPKPT
jgi:Family of unknown function (DUF6338)